MTVLAQIEDLTITFPGSRRPAVAGLSLTIHSGETVALVGESGSGKSLTAKTLLGLLPETAEVSHALLLVPHHREPIHWREVRGSSIGMVPQDALGGLDPLRRIEHEVGDALRLHTRARRSTRRERVITALNRAGMPDAERRARQRSDELSGGLRQRALVASALISEPALIIADEPTTALDAGHRTRVLELLRERTKNGAGLLLVTHDLASVREFADVVHVMRDGRIVESGTPAGVFAAPQHPFTRQLIDASLEGRESRVSRVARRGGSPHATTGDGAPPLRLELRDISVSFATPTGHPHHVLTDASLTVAAGETVGLLGESGSGKTTLMRVALSLETAHSGRVILSGVDRHRVRRATRRALYQRIAHVPQDPLSSFPPRRSGRQILEDALRASGVPRALRRARAYDLAEEVGLDTEALNRSVLELSGGERQRIAIARALARDPELILLDEPVSALDTTVQERVLALLDKLQARRGTSYLLVSHDEAVIHHMSDRVLRLDSGRISEEASTRRPRQALADAQDPG